jgi:hypothetical protein
MKTAIATGDVAAVSSLLAEEPARANTLIEWGKNCEIRTHPLHFVSDMLFSGTLERGKEIPIVDILLAAGADINHQSRNGETPLIGAASLGAEDVGLRLLEAGARPDAKGAFGETALHWAACLGLDRLVARLIQRGSDVNQKDARYNSPPLGWAIHGRFHSAPGSRRDFGKVVGLLVAAGATVESDWLADEQIRADSSIFSALTGHARHPHNEPPA